MENIEEIYSVPVIHMMQFEPSNYSLSSRWDVLDHIKIALAHGIRLHCEIQKPEDTQYHMDLGIKNFEWAYSVLEKIGIQISQVEFGTIPCKRRDEQIYFLQVPGCWH